MADWQNPVAVARRLAYTLEAAGLPYAIGGALALSYYTPPRGTVDADIFSALKPFTCRQASLVVNRLSVAQGSNEAGEGGMSSIRVGHDAFSVMQGVQAAQ